jgi:hypothetical protein
MVFPFTSMTSSFSSRVAAFSSRAKRFFLPGRYLFLSGQLLISDNVPEADQNSYFPVHLTYVKTIEIQQLNEEKTTKVLHKKGEVQRSLFPVACNKVNIRIPVSATA